MPAKIVEVPGVGNVEFPDSMSDADIAKQLSAHTATQPKPEAGKDSRGFFESAWDKINPLPAIREWMNRPAALSDAQAAFHALTEIHNEAAKDPANKGLPVNKWKLRDPTAEEHATIEKGMSAQLPGAEGNILNEAAGPAVEASGQAMQGNLKGAAGTLAGGYVAPVIIGKAISKLPAAAARVAEEAQKPGTGQIVKGGAQMAVGVPTAFAPNPIGHLGGELTKTGLLNILEGIRVRRAAGIPEAELFKAPEPAVPAVAEPVAPQPVPETAPIPESVPAVAESQPVAAIKAQTTQAPVTPPEPAFVLPEWASTEPTRHVPPTGTRWGTMSKTQVERGYLEMLNRKGRLNPEQAARLDEMKSAAPTAEPAASIAPSEAPPTVTKIPFSDEAKTAATSAKMEAVNRSLKTDVLSRVLKDAGVDLEAVSKWKPTGPEWKAVTYAANEILKTEGESTTMGNPSKASIAETLFKMRKAAAPRVEGLAISGKPAALAAAQALADEMNK